MAWLGRKKLAFIPLSRTNIQPPDVIPPDWPGQIMQRLFFDPATDPTTGLPIPGTDRSVRAYFHTVSSGLADLDVVVLPPQTIPEQDVPPDALEATMGAQLRSDGFVGAAIVMLGGPGAGSTVSVGNFGWSRFVMAEGLGVWVGELLHQGNLCDLRDLFVNAGNYPADENMGPFDQEAGYQATHLSAWTKRAVGWLDPSTVALHPGGVAEYILHSVSLIQPPPTGRIAAVQIGTKVPYLMVEARLKADQFDFNIPNEGVIVYRVQITDSSVEAQDATIPLALITKTALTSGQSITTDGATIDVGGAVLGGGFSVLVTTPEPGQSPWTTVAEGRSTPGAPVTAVLTGQNRIALFLADPNGGIYTISGFGESWGQWKTVAEGRSTPGAPRHGSAVRSESHRIVLSRPQWRDLHNLGLWGELGTMENRRGGTQHTRRASHGSADRSESHRIVLSRPQWRDLHNLGLWGELGTMENRRGGTQHTRRASHGSAVRSESHRIVLSRPQWRDLHNLGLWGELGTMENRRGGTQHTRRPRHGSAVRSESHRIVLSRPQWRDLHNLGLWGELGTMENRRGGTQHTRRAMSRQCCPVRIASHCS